VQVHAKHAEIRVCVQVTERIDLNISAVTQYTLSIQYTVYRPRNTKLGTEVAHVTRDSDTTFKVKRSMVNLQGRGILY